MVEVARISPTRGVVEALAFLASVGRPPRPHDREVVLDVDGGIVADVWDGRRGPIVVFHGMAVHGHRDPRQRAACAALHDLGFRVIAPRLPRVAALALCPSTPSRIGRVVRSIADDPSLSASGRAAVFAVSFSGGMALRGLEDPAVYAVASSFLALGTYGDPSTALEAVLTRPDVDPYARLVLYANALPFAWGLDDESRALLDLAVQDSGLSRSEPALPSALDKASTKARSLIRGLSTGALRRDAARAVLSHIADWLPEFHPSSDPRMGLPITLLHGAHDRVIPAAESVALGRRLSAAGGRVTACITPLLSHGDPQLSATQVAEAARVSRAIGRFLAAA